MISCPKCTKDNQDHYKFCLGCGTELPRGAGARGAPAGPMGTERSATPAAPAATVVPTSGPSTVPAVETIAAGSPEAAPQVIVPPSPPAPTIVEPPQAAPAPAPPPAVAAAAVAAPAPAAGTCPQCGHSNAPSNLFCGACGFRLAPPAAKPIPIAQTTIPQAAVATTSVTLTALRADGSDGGSFTFTGSSATIGRETGSIFAGDSYLSPKHALIKQSPGRVTVRDDNSVNGVYKKLAKDVPVELRPGDNFRIGQEIIQFEPIVSEPPDPSGVERLGSPSKGYIGRIALVIGRNVTGNAFPIPEQGVNLGRERGDVLFPEDGYVSGLHCRISQEAGRTVLTDLGSSNGTFVRLREEVEVKTGDVLLMGQQLFRVSVGT